MEELREQILAMSKEEALALLQLGPTGLPPEMIDAAGAADIVRTMLRGRLRE